VDSKSLDDEELAKEFERSFHHVSALERLNETLKTRYSDAANRLHVRVVQRLRELRKASIKPSSRDVAEKWMASFLAVRGLSKPDRRPFHRYRMTDVEFAEAEVVLRRLASSRKLVAEDRLACGIFAAFCAEWFRREASSTFQKWDALAPDIFPLIPGNQKRAMAEAGLSFWGRTVSVMNDANKYLLSLALEGGVPVKIIADEGSGWLRDYLRLLLRFALQGYDAALVRGYAHDESYRIKLSYRNDTFVDLCAELASEVAKWRNVVEGEAIAGVDPVSFLDANFPDWKESIPLYLRAGEDSAARALLTGLITEKLEVISGQGIGCDRLLHFENDCWKPAIRIQATGEIPVSKLHTLSPNARWRATPSGLLADYLPSELAIFEPPVEEQRTWRVRPLTDLSRIVTGFPLNAKVSVNISANGRVEAFDWPNGHRVVSDVLVFQELEPSNTPKLLKLVKAGSASLPSPKLFALIPASWKVEAAEGAVARSWTVFDRLLIEVTGTCYVSDPENLGAGRYRVQAGSEGTDETLEFTSRSCIGISANGEFDVMESPVKVSLLRMGIERHQDVGELFVRQIGGVWRPLMNGEVRDLGLVEISWRDPKANIQIERRRFAVVPPGASLKGVTRTPRDGHIALTGLVGWGMTLSAVARETAKHEGSTSFEFIERPNYRIPAVLHPPSGQSFSVLVPVLARDAAILNAVGEVVDPGKQLDLASLRGTRAVTSHKSVLVISRKGAKSQDLAVEVDGEFAISTLKPMIEEIMATAGEQDVQLDMHFLGDTRPPIRLTKYRWERPSYANEVVSFSGAIGKPQYRSIIRPEIEEQLEAAGGDDFRLPEHEVGPCLAYLRDGPDILTRPRLLIGQNKADFEPGTLRAALSIEAYSALQKAIADRLETLGGDTAAADDLAYLRSAIVHLGGLPPSALESLRNLPRYPKVLVRLVMGASDEDRLAIWNLQGQLPFMWLGIEWSSWKQAFDLERSLIEEALLAVPGTAAFKMEILVNYFRSKLEGLATLEPGLMAVFSALGFPFARGLKSLEQVVEDYIKDQRNRDTDDREKLVRAAPLARHVAEIGLAFPSHLERQFSFSDFDALYAPALLAASACGRTTINTDLQVPLRAAIHENGPFVSEAYPHFFNFFRTNT